MEAHRLPVPRRADLRPAAPLRRKAAAVMSCMLLGTAGPSLAQSVTPASLQAPAEATLPAGLDKHLRTVALDNVAAPRAARVELEVGELDPRLKLAPCDRIEPFVPNGTRLWGRSRIGLRCMAGPVAWKVYLPVTVKVFGQALVAAGPLPAGSELTVLDMRDAEVDLTTSPAATYTDADKLAGRLLVRALAPGEPVRSDALRARQWFGAGDMVTLTAAGRGFAVSGEGQALNAGLEGQPVRVRTESGRVVTGLPVGVRRVEVGL
jgi:flagella basal body P-ring formation protein FlgA